MTMDPISVEVMRKIRALRQIQSVSAQKLADRINALGYPISRGMIANLENQRKQSLPLDYAVLASKALGTTLAELMTGPAKCPNCGGEPPAGFTCNTCGTEAEVAD